MFHLVEALGQHPSLKAIGGRLIVTSGVCVLPLKSMYSVPNKYVYCT